MARNNFPFCGRRAGCDARRSERRVASHTSEEQRRSAPALRPQNGKLFWAMSLAFQGIPVVDSLSFSSKIPREYLDIDGRRLQDHRSYEVRHSVENCTGSRPAKRRSLMLRPRTVSVKFRLQARACASAGNYQLLALLDVDIGRWHLTTASVALPARDPRPTRQWH